MPLPKQPRVAPALAPAPLHMDVPSMGVLYTAHVPPLSPKSKSHPFLLEAARSARLLRSRMSPSYPLAMLANARARLELRAAHVLGLWDVHRSPELLPPPEILAREECYERPQPVRAPPLSVASVTV